MPISVQGTQITFNDGTNQTTAFTGSGGVTSLNGQTGAITNTGLDNIGSYVAAIYALNFPSSCSSYSSRYTVGNTIAGSSLRYNYTPNDPSVQTNGNSLLGLGGSRAGSGAGPNLSVSYPGGGSSLSGTWRCMGQDLKYFNNNFDCTSRAVWAPGLWVRIS
jgi:hypothetical protein